MSFNLLKKPAKDKDRGSKNQAPSKKSFQSQNSSISEDYL